MFTSARTFFSFVTEGVNRAEILEMGNLLRKELSRILFYEELPAPVIRKVMEEVSGIGFGKASNRSVLTSMADLIRLYNDYADRLKDEGRSDSHDR